MHDLADGGIAQFGNSTTQLGEIADGKSLIDEFIREASGALRAIAGDK